MKIISLICIDFYDQPIWLENVTQSDTSAYILLIIASCVTPRQWSREVATAHNHQKYVTKEYEDHTSIHYMECTCISSGKRSVWYKSRRNLTMQTHFLHCKTEITSPSDFGQRLNLMENCGWKKFSNFPKLAQLANGT